MELVTLEISSKESEFSDEMAAVINNDGNGRVTISVSDRDLMLLACSLMHQYSGKFTTLIIEREANLED